MGRKTDFFGIDNDKLLEKSKGIGSKLLANY